MFSPFSSDTRLFALEWRDAAFDLPVEAWWGAEAVSSGFEFCIDLLSTDAFIELKHMLGQAVTLHSTLSDGSRSSRSGLVRSVLKLGADGGFCRYRITLVPWTWLLSRGRHNRVFQDKTVVQIVDAVFADYAEHAAWHWSEEVAEFLADARPRSYCVQYMESDYTFVSRLLAEEGIGWCIEDDTGAPAGHRLRLFADSPRWPEDALSEHANGGRGIRFHRADSQEDQDAIVAFGECRRFGAAIGSVLSYDYKAKRAVAVSLPTALSIGGTQAPALEAYDDAGLYAFANAREAERYQHLMMEALEARHTTFQGRSTVRSFRPGTAFDLLDAPSPIPAATANAAEPPRLSLLALTHIGINNLSGEPMAAIAKRLGAAALMIDEATTGEDDAAPIRAPHALPTEALALAAERGYANAFEAQPGTRPWRPQLTDDTGARLNPRPTVHGPMSAVVVGPNGETRPNGADEIWCDRLGRIKIRFHWQQAHTADDRGSCWVRVVTRQAGPGMGWQALPRIGQEVFVTFLGNDIDRPLVLGALYNGQGEGGITPTPGGADAKPVDRSVFEQSTDHSPAAQGNLTAGNSPAWHGAAASQHNHAAALSGFKTKEFGAHGRFAGHNQLVFDDTDNQQRAAVHSTQYASQLNLGHLIHQADNYRGSFRGTGAELRTDAWGALRAARGITLSTWAQHTDAEPAGDMAPAAALLGQADALAQTLSKAAATHQTVQLAAAIGSGGPQQSAIDPNAAPLKALHTVARGMVDGADFDAALADAKQKNTATAGKLPHLTDAAIIQAAKAGLGFVAGGHIQLSNGETISLISGEDTNLAVAGKTRIHTGQAIGLLAGAIRAGADNTGITMIAAKDDIEMQAQSDEMKFQARDDLEMVSITEHIDFAAGKRIVLATEGGASITIDGGITVECPGTITVHASKKSFAGPTRGDYGLPTFPQTVCKECLLAAMKAGSPFATMQ
ncbi:type VI secretion system Vgr family protein [Denitromonas ohlonensis]|uniref:Type VI secretion system tip protein VgrG n=2 Tax=Denitromonas TaxID=139331 RepID=A0A557SGE1_9RHOO|nr:type VI secretion system Vgr family protein [Denitromonas ohlonensis]TVO67605.1 type VI secretion system tip protein VgrG [Denitromonas ohlonensis]TVO76463.1 type VI secretion system tip protein VgrG [Denitromonas ohlonensis]